MYKYLSLLLLFLSGSVYGQYWQQIDSVFSVSGVSVKSFSAPQFADLNDDGMLDLILGTNSDFAEFFRNNSSDFPTTFTKDSTLLNAMYGGGLMGTNSDYPAFVDLDNDGDLDLVMGGYNGLLFYENSGTPDSAILIQGDTLLFSALNTEIGSDPQPAFCDLDDDGDYDLFIGIGESLLGGPTPGITLAYRNTGSAENPQFTLDNSLAAGIPDIGLNAYPSFADLDDDGDYDLLYGRDLSTLVYYINSGDRQTPSWSVNSSLFSGVESETYWKNPDLADLDYDGDYDLVYGTASGKLYVYRNTGTATAPAFEYYPDYFEIIKLDGSAATVSLADFDNDGDADLLSGIWSGRFIYFENQGSDEMPVFRPSSSSFSSLDAGSFSSPVFVDIDGDGDFDIASGALTGEVVLFLNEGGSWTQNTTMFAAIDVGFSSFPSFADLDNDGDLDLLVGAETGSNTEFYLNDGSNNYQLDNSFFSGVTFPSYGKPVLADIDNDTDYDLVIGGGWGDVSVYENTGTPESPVWSVNDSIFAGVEVSQSAAPGFADLDGDTKKDMIIGEYDGNFTYFKNLFAQPIVGIDQCPAPLLPSEYVLHQNYPNPFNPATIIEYSLPDQGYVSLKVYDLLGEETDILVSAFQQPGQYRVTYDASHLSGGVYFYSLQVNGFTESKKLLLLK